MKIKMLPNWGKKFGLFLFFTGFIVASTTVSARQSFYEGYSSASNSLMKRENFEPIFIEKWFGELGTHLFDVLTILGLLVYMISKEKIEDDYINMLRLESYQFTSILTLFITLTLYVFAENLKLSLDIFITLYLMTYLLNFAIIKRRY
ncbi:hypothetical protein [Polaribacter glomeratus]|uniref:Uncharacterized protein n=1 Tax=Polaribacter glomeratus TaxID=102 RepID=A0A2S7WFU5_9FLAO|nr:hypothetical protein [Polaribacter glomeratus]PQJ76467.1 hypothetical protein BTO16_11185 [Polaribacter glomeratus]TXD65601.1 hypothetical protein ESX12_10490 [Polaribacter glomeratus]